MTFMAQKFKSAIKLKFPAIWKLLAETGVQIPIGSNPRKLFWQDNNLVMLEIANFYP